MLNLELGDLLKRNMILTGNRHKGGVYEFACILGKVVQDCSIISRGQVLCFKVIPTDLQILKCFNKASK